MTVKYTSQAFTEAHDRFLTDATRLTDEDVAQLALVDADLADRARAKRAGFVEAKGHDATWHKPVKWKDLLKWQRDILMPLLGTYRLKSREAHTRLDDLERRIVELEKRPAGIKDAGVWKSGVTYHPGDIVSHQGSGWICSMTHDSTGNDVDHSAFRLLVMRGRDGRNSDGRR